MEIEVTQAKVEMQTVTTKVVLFEMEGASTMLSGGDTLERVVHHEIKELGQHVLACTVTYRLPPNSRSVPGASEDATDPSLQTFRKFYKFAVRNHIVLLNTYQSCVRTGSKSALCEDQSAFSQISQRNVICHGTRENIFGGSHSELNSRRYLLRAHALGMYGRLGSSGWQFIS